MSQERFEQEWRSYGSRIRLIAMVAVGAVVTVVIGLTSSWKTAPIAGWGAAALTFLAWVWLAVARMNAAQTATHATREDPSRAVSDLLVLLANVISVVVIYQLLGDAKSAHGTTANLLALAAILSGALSWLLINTLYMLRYASLYYRGPAGRVDFNSDDPPQYTDFAYLAFTMGMTYQVSDTDLKDHVMRVTALRHALLSYTFGAIILATTINLVAGLGRG